MLSSNRKARITIAAKLHKVKFVTNVEKCMALDDGFLFVIKVIEMITHHYHTLFEMCVRTMYVTLVDAVVLVSNMKML